MYKLVICLMGRRGGVAEIQTMTPSGEEDMETFPHGWDYTRISTTIPAIKTLNNNSEDSLLKSK